MGSPEGTARVVDLGKALGSDGHTLSGYHVPEALLQDPSFVLQLKAYVGRNRTALQAGRTTSGWEPRQKFFDFVHGHNHVSFLHSLVSVADLFFQTKGLRAADYGLLFKLVNFFRDFTEVPQETLLAVKAEIELRASTRREQEAWAEHRRIVEQQEKDEFPGQRDDLYCSFLESQETTWTTCSKRSGRNFAIRGDKCGRETFRLVNWALSRRSHRGFQFQRNLTRVLWLEGFCKEKARTG